MVDKVSTDIMNVSCILSFFFLDSSHEKTARPHFQINSSKHLAVTLCALGHCKRMLHAVSIHRWHPILHPIHFICNLHFFVESSRATICDWCHAYIHFFLFSAENSTLLARTSVQMSHGASNTRLFVSAECCAVCRGHTVFVSTVFTEYQGHAEPKLVNHLHYATS